MKRFTLILFVLPFLFFGKLAEPTLAKQEAKNAFEYLNQIRLNPKNYKSEIGNFMKDIKPAVALKWNDTLAKVAEVKAMDMAKNNYFSHTDKKGYGMNYYINLGGYKLDKNFLKNKKDNYFESIAYNYKSGKESIKELVIDKSEPSKGHRKHLLGLSDFYKNCKDIGIGYAKINRGKGYEESYVCILIAKHTF